jgi:photosystem II stability/assembly factor-like uncharacterized protein
MPRIFTKQTFPLLLALTATFLVLAPAAAQQAAPEAATITEADLAAIHPRVIGPAVTGGRITDVDVDPTDMSTVYVATAAGGLWKSTTRTHQWTNIFADQPVATFGAVTLAPSNPQIIYAGTGEPNNRNSTSWGNGVYRSDDGGESWRHLGLEGTRHVGEILVHPTDPDIAYVAGLGNLWATGPERGVFRTTDGGSTWEKVLYLDEFTGAVDLAMHPTDPGIIYAGMYARLRKAWGFNGGGPNGGIYKSTDGGDSWDKLAGGLPEGHVGRIGLDISRSNPEVLVALVEAPNRPDPNAQQGGRGNRDPGNTGSWRTEDGGATWERLSDQNQRPMYYSHIWIHPANPDLVISASTNSQKSTDGGRTWETIAAQPSYDVGVHLDMHAVWWDPADTDHWYLAGDGGLHETFDGGLSYRKINNFPIGQFYGIGVDMRDPYWVYGGMQDNHSWMGPSETRRFDGILNEDWQQIGFSDGMHQQVDKAGPRYVYSAATSGSYTRVDVISGTKKSISPPSLQEDGGRNPFDWTSPSLASMHEEGLVYVGGRRLFISRDFGDTWTHSEELDRGIDTSGRELMGVEHQDVYISRNDGVGSFGVISTMSESPIDGQVLWIGTDDGNLRYTRDQGETWAEVSQNVPGIPDGIYVSRVEASAHDLGTAMATFDGHRDGDFAPYVYRTTDWGVSWTPIHTGLPTGSANALVEHPHNPNVLFLGTEHAAWVTTDLGAKWAKIQNLPTTTHDDLIIHPREMDLVMGTHGNSIWILDDTRFLGEWTREAVEAPAHLFSMDEATLFRYRKDNSYIAQAEFTGQNPPDGVEITYRLGQRNEDGDGDAEVVISRANGEVVRRMTVPNESGTHRINWDLRHGDPENPDRWERFDEPGYTRSANQSGEAFVSPGMYEVTLVARDWESSQTLRVVGDPLLELSDEDYRATEDYILRVSALGQELRAAVAAASEDDREPLQALLRQIRGLERRVGNVGRFNDGNFGPPSAADQAALQELAVEAARVMGG